ncbi:MAG: hypothetical protein ACR2MG_13820 [Pyrinomonadaceae bacterium]
MKFSKKLLLKIFLTVCLFSPLINCEYTQSEIVRCSQQHFECYKGKTETRQEIKQIAERAAQVVGTPSPGIPKKVYLTKFSLSDTDPSGRADSEPAFYAQTNFKPQTSHSNKFFITDGFSRIPGEIEKITGESEIDTKNIAYYIEEKLLLDERFREFFDAPERFENKSPLFLIGADGKELPLKRIRQNGQIVWAVNTGKSENLFHSFKKPESFYLLQKDGQLKPISEIIDHLYIYLEALEEFNKIADMPIKIDKIRVLNFFNHDGSMEIIEKNFPNQQVKFNFKEMENRKLKKGNLKALENHFISDSNTMVFVIVHIEDEDYKIENAAGDKTPIPIKELEEIAALHNVNIIHLGCNSSLHSESGTIDIVSSHNIAESLAKAVKAKTVKEFYTKLVSENLMFVIGSTLVEETRIKLGAITFINKDGNKNGKGNGGNNGNRGGGGNGGNNGNGGNGNEGGNYEYDEVGKINVSFPRKPFLLPSPTPSPTPDDGSTLSQESSGAFLYLVLGLGGLGSPFIIYGLLRKMIEVQCPSCGKTNRVIKKSKESAICRNRGCKKPLF